MEEELTREELKRFIFFAKDKDTRKLAAALLEEMDKPKVWDGAPEEAIEASVAFFKAEELADQMQGYWHGFVGQKGGYLNHVTKTYTRELPKTRARIMAEEIAAAQISNKSDLVDIIEQTINTHMKELKGEE